MEFREVWNKMYLRGSGQNMVCKEEGGGMVGLREVCNEMDLNK